MPDPFFVCFDSEGQHVLFNLYQIVRVCDITEDQITIYCSDGSANTFHGVGMGKKIASLLYSLVVEPPPDGVTPAGPRLVIPIDSEK
jgi:hypothetical protein